MITIYRHRRTDTDEIFYIGIGSSVNRAYSKRNRNNYWHNTVNKYGYTVEIVTTCETWSEACQIEQYLIKYYGRRDLGTGSLVNMTDGGDGMLGFKHTEETKKKLSELQMGREANEGSFKKGNTPWNKEVKGEAHPLYGIKISEEHRNNISISHTGVPLSESHKKRLSESALKSGRNKGGNNPAARKIIDTDTNIIYDSVRDVAKDFNVHETTVHRWLKGNNSKKLNLKYYE